MRPVGLVVACASLALPLGTVAAQPSSPASNRPPSVASLVRTPSLVAAVMVATPPGRTTYRRGEPIPVTVTLGRRTVRGEAVLVAPVAGRLSLQLVQPDGTVLGRLGPVATTPSGTVSAVLPGAWTREARVDASTDYVSWLAVEVVDAAAEGLRTARAGASAAAVGAPPTGLVLHNDFTSAVGWVKPGETYPFRYIVRNYSATAATDVVVTAAPADGMRFTRAQPSTGAGTADIVSEAIRWNLGTVPGTSHPASPVVRTLVLEARADTTGEDPRIVWKNLSTTAVLTGSAGTSSAIGHGPKVIPPDVSYDTARYGDRPFPVVPVDYFERQHQASHSGEVLADKINSPDVAGSTFNLYQEMSYGQLFPNGSVPSAGIATAGWPKTFQFRDPQPQGTCPPDGLVTAEALQGTPAYPERIRNGWYRLPGTTNYYGSDKTGSAIAGSVTGQGILFDIDSACGPTAKAVYDAAHIADPEIDYSLFDTDKDGVVDFFMMVFVGLGGNGVSQGLRCDDAPPDSALDPDRCPTPAPYDNIWPHSSSLEFTYTDAATGLTGYVSDDQLKDLEDRPLWYTDDTRSRMTTTDTGDELKVFVRVGPYNVNPESSITKASVISHEYGHSLGLPDFYSTGGRSTYGDFNLMATDKSQNMDVFAKQEMGWIVPRALPTGTTKVTGWRDSKVNTHRIDWVTPDGTPYALTGASVANGEAYTAKLPGRQLISPQLIEQGASPTHVWWSGSGNDFGCSPQQGHNFDIALPELADLAAGAEVKVEFASWWDIEWDYDYGFVLVSPDGGRSYVSQPSALGYTTPTQNRNANACQGKYGNGLTGTSGSYERGTQEVDRLADEYPDGPFLRDSYDISELAGAERPVLRFSYATDPGLAHPGWFIDDIVVTVDGEPIWQSDFEDLEADRERTYNGGCREDTRVSSFCTDGWQYVSSSEAARADHGYYLEMRDRSGFDFDGKGENDRAPIAFIPGPLLVYTDEAHGYGNAGTDDPPAQSPLDDTPQVGNSTPNLNDAAWDEGKTFSDASHVDNYEDPSSESGNWEFTFGCLSFTVDRVDGEDVGPNSPVGAGGNLDGDVTFTTTDSCAAFDYGHARATVDDAAPVAVARVRPASATAQTGQQLTFDASESHDDSDAVQDLRYDWSFGDGSSASGRVVTHAYAAAGTFLVTLRVTDTAGQQAEDTLRVTVRSGSGEPGGDKPTQPHPATGGPGGLGLLGFAALLTAGLAARLRRS